MSRKAALLADVVVVLVFATVGRASHEEGLTLLGRGQVAWPFLVGTAAGLGWARTPTTTPARIKVGVRVWLLTLVVGMVLRRLTDAGTAASFVVVATVVLGVLFAGLAAGGAGPAVDAAVQEELSASRPCGVRQPDGVRALRHDPARVDVVLDAVVVLLDLVEVGGVAEGRRSGTGRARSPTAPASR